jgi:hypothetical protein
LAGQSTTALAGDSQVQPNKIGDAAERQLAQQPCHVHFKRAILLFGESREVARLVSIGLIVAGIVGLKLPTPDNN